MNIQKDLLYSSTHEWVKFLEGDAALVGLGSTALVGLSDYAQHSLTDVVFITLPSEGDEVTAGESLGDVESVKAVSDILSPVTGTVAEVNEDVDQSPQLINQDPYGSWLVKVEDITERADLMDADVYAEFCAGLEE